MTRIKAVAMFSGGLDSILATKLILRQGIEVEAINFQGFFCSCKSRETNVSETAKQLGVPLRTMIVGNEYLRLLRKPRHGYGKNMNPCIDCKIFMLKKAKKHAKRIGAAFVFTGEVINERPMSQHIKALETIEKESGLKGKLLRPLSARLLPETSAEKQGLVDRSQLLSVRGRSRKPQIKLAEEFGISRYPSPAGGCLLTEADFATKLRDLFAHRRRLVISDVALLKLGRHFRFGENRIIVGRNEGENGALVREKNVNDYFFEAENVAGPTTILQGKKTKKSVELAAALTAFYSDADTQAVTVKYGRHSLEKSTVVQVPTRAEVEALRIGRRC
jgi:tRNA U34 2-thiouridine synthase MnmA/TrmU